MRIELNLRNSNHMNIESLHQCGYKMLNDSQLLTSGYAAVFSSQQNEIWVMATKTFLEHQLNGTESRSAR